MPNHVDLPADAANGGGADAHAELTRIAAELHQATLDVAWQQWRVLGAGTASHSQRTARPGRASSQLRDEARAEHALVDPEALVLISLVLVHDERRLADLLHDWAVRNSDLLSVQRLNNLAHSYPAPIQKAMAPQLAWFAGVANERGKDLRWRPLAQPTAESAGAESVADYLRSRRESRRGATMSLKSRVTRARLTGPTTLLPRLRLGFGVGVKADLLAFLLARDEAWTTIRDIVEATAYTAAAVRRAAADLATARLVQSLSGQPASYRVEYATWAPLLGLEERRPRWGSWHERFLFTAVFLAWADSARGRPLSSYALGVKGREILELHRAAFERDHLAVWSVHSPIDDWAEYLGRAIHTLATWMREMA